MYSQYKEDEVVLKYFNNRNISVLDIGANDGITISNSFAFVERGCTCVLVEASPITFKKLLKNMDTYENVYCINSCISDKVGNTKFYHNTTHFNKDDKDLLSTIVESSYLESKKTNNFDTFDISTVDFEEFIKNSPIKEFDYISIDIEGMDFIVLSQINLNLTKTDLLLIEYNNNLTIKNKIVDYCKIYGLENILLDNGTNIILAK